MSETYNKSMISRIQRFEQNRYLRRHNKLLEQLWIERTFQTRHLIFILATTALGFLILSAPFYYMVSKNHEIFRLVAYKSAPELIGPLDTEMKWLHTFTALSLFITLCCSFLISRYFAKHFLRPISLLDQHIKKMTKKKPLPPITDVPKDHELYRLIHNYNHLHQTLERETRDDIKKIEELEILNQRSEEKKELFLTEKRKKLGQVEPIKLKSAEVITLPKIKLSA